MNAAFAVNLSQPAINDVTVQYSTSNGTATSPEDYTAISPAQTLTIPHGSSSASLSVSVIGDSKYETTETFFVNLSNSTNATIADSQGTGTITNDDTVPSIIINNMNVAEGSSGTVNANFTVTLSAASGVETKVNYSTAPKTATAGSDYQTTSGILTIPPGNTTGTITIPVFGDAIDESNETFNVNLTSPLNATISDSQGQGTITNAKPALTINDVSLNEGNSGTTNAVFTVTSSFAYNVAVSATYTTVSVSAISPGDFTAVSGTVTLPAFATTATIPVPVVGDTLFEAGETFNVTLSGAVKCTISDSKGIATILNDDAAPSLSINDVTMAEGNSGSVDFVFTVSLSTASGAITKVKFATVKGTAIPPADYVTKSLTLSIPAGSLSATVAVQVVGDTILEPNETFTGKLSSPTNGTIGDATGIATILNDD